MRIIIYAHEFCIKEGGPCTHRMDSFASYLSEAGHDVIVLTGKHNKKKEYKKVDRKYNIIYSSILALGKKKNIYRLLEQVSFSITSFFVGLFKLKKADFLITTSPPPLISYTGYFLSRIKRAKFIFDVRDIWPDVAVEMGSFNKDGFYYKVFNHIAQKMYKKADFITTVSPGKVKKIQGYCKDKNKVWYIPNGLDDNFLFFKENPEIIQKYKLKNNFIVSYIGNVGLAQNLDILVDLAKHNIEKKDVKFLIVGDGAYKDTIAERIEKEKLYNIEVIGRVDYENVYSILKNSAISFVSLKNMNMLDSIPTKIFDALGIGCPVLLYANGDSADIVRESKLGENATSFEELCDKFDNIYNNYDKYKRNEKYCINYIISNYSRREIARELEKRISTYIKGDEQNENFIANH